MSSDVQVEMFVKEDRSDPGYVSYFFTLNEVPGSFNQINGLEEIIEMTPQIEPIDEKDANYRLEPYFRNDRTISTDHRGDPIKGKQLLRLSKSDFSRNQSQVAQMFFYDGKLDPAVSWPAAAIAEMPTLYLSASHIDLVGVGSANVLYLDVPVDSPLRERYDWRAIMGRIYGIVNGPRQQ
jgi:hypothetical protein